VASRSSSRTRKAATAAARPPSCRIRCGRASRIDDRSRGLALLELPTRARRRNPCLARANWRAAERSAAQPDHRPADRLLPHPLGTDRITERRHRNGPGAVLTRLAVGVLRCCSSCRATCLPAKARPPIESSGKSVRRRKNYPSRSWDGAEGANPTRSGGIGAGNRGGDHAPVMLKAANPTPSPPCRSAGCHPRPMPECRNSS
jgi:hypothetical protein